jgi:hypothetical protein
VQFDVDFYHSPRSCSPKRVESFAKIHFCRKIKVAGLLITNPRVRRLIDPTYLLEPETSCDRIDRERLDLIRWSWGFVGLGILLRALAYLQNFPLWWDEAFLAVNLLRRDYSGLMKPLDYGQVAPIFFLWAELASVRLLGFNEWALRLFPWICSIFGMVLFRVVAGRVLEARAMFLAVAVFAVSVHPIRHSADVKPYATDLLVALILQGLALLWWRRPEISRWLWVLTGFGPMALMLSHPSIFVVAGVGLTLAWPAWETRARNVRLALIAYGVSTLSVYAALYVLFTRDQASVAAPGMKEMWVRSFPPLDSVLGFLGWVVVAHSGDMLAYPCGGERGASTFSLLACLLGVLVLVRRRLWTNLGILLAPLALAIVAAGLRLYPYGGPAPHGSAARIMQYAAPALCLLIGLGASTALDAIRSVSWRSRLFRWACLGLLSVGFVSQAASYRHPYRAYQAQAARKFSRQFWPEISRGAEVVDLRWDFPVAEWDSIHLGIAVSLCNEAIDSPSRRRGGPKLSDVSTTHPLRCVLGVAPDRDGPQIIAWLAAMEPTYLLRKREVIRVRINEPGRRAEFERFEVFEFVPRPMIGSQPRSEAQAVNGS